MGKKKFISKGEGQHFYLLHRSQTDEAYAGEQRPSDFVLVPAQDNGNVRRQQQKEEIKLVTEQDHITPLGFKNDGYDYSQHLKEMGGGRFIGKDGERYEVPYGQAVDLPADALPSEGELDRHLEAVTISHEFMDDDLRAALFNEEDSEGGFEELQDDFCVQVMTEPEVPDFDFDAHIAELIARSEQCTQKASVGPRGWENDQELMKKGVMKRGKKGEDEYYDEGEYEEDSENWSEADEEEDDIGRSSSTPQRSKRAPRASNKMDEDFEKFLEDEYDDGQVGYIDEAEEEELQGCIDLEGSNTAFNQALEEFMQEKEDSILAHGVTWTKGARALLDDQPVEGVPDVQKEVADQIRRQDEGEQQVAHWAENVADHQALLTCQEYLREERVREEWDCESIISTYSTLDNHPSVIRDSNSSFRPYKSRHAKAADKETAIAAAGAGAYLAKPDAESESESSSLSSYSVKGYQALQTLPSQPQHKALPVPIVLRGKLGLPDGYAPDRNRKPRSLRVVDDENSSVASGTSGGGSGTGSRNGVAQTTSALSTLALSSSRTRKGGRKFRGSRLTDVKEGDEDEEEGSTDDAVEEDDDDDDDDDDEDYDDDDDDGTVMTTASMIRARGETPEQRKIRKATVKEDKRAKRVMKKQLKLAYKDEFSRQSHIASKQQSLNNTSVFKYSV